MKDGTNVNRHKEEEIILDSKNDINKLKKCIECYMMERMVQLRQGIIGEVNGYKDIRQGQTVIWLNSVTFQWVKQNLKVKLKAEWSW